MELTKIVHVNNNLIYEESFSIMTKSFNFGENNKRIFRVNWHALQFGQFWNRGSWKVTSNIYDTETKTITIQLKRNSLDCCTFLQSSFWPWSPSPPFAWAILPAVPSARCNETWNQFRFEFTILVIGTVECYRSVYMNTLTKFQIAL